MEKFSNKVLNGINSVRGMDTTLLMVCIGALGVLLGVNVPGKLKNIFSVVAVFAFISASIPAVSKIAGKMLDNDADEYFSDEDCFEQ